MKNGKEDNHRCTDCKNRTILLMWITFDSCRPVGGFMVLQRDGIAAFGISVHRQ